MIISDASKHFIGGVLCQKDSDGIERPIAYTSRALFKLILGWDPVDMVVENKKDEDHYYAGKAYRGIKNKFN